MPKIKHRLCRWCGEFIGKTEVSIGFGNGTGEEFVHSFCFDEYTTVRDAIFAKRTENLMTIWSKFLETHKTLIRQREREL